MEISITTIIFNLLFIMLLIFLLYRENKEKNKIIDNNSLKNIIDEKSNQSVIPDIKNDLNKIDDNVQKDADNTSFIPLS